MPPPGDQHNFNPSLVRSPQRRQILRRDLITGIEQRAININGQQPRALTFLNPFIAVILSEGGLPRVLSGAGNPSRRILVLPS